MQDTYAPTTFDQVVVLEFYMPLTQEGTLRRTLDSLFYEDVIVPRLRRIGADRLKAVFGDGDETSLVERATRFIDQKFRGYSIYRVDGRFRSGPLTTLRDAAEIARTGTYLADETTAVCRFVFPCSEGEPAKVRFSSTSCSSPRSWRTSKAKSRSGSSRAGCATRSGSGGTAGRLEAVSQGFTIGD